MDVGAWVRISGYAHTDAANHSLAAAPKAFPGAAAHKVLFSSLYVAESRKEIQSPKSQCSIRPDSYRHFTPRFKASVLPEVRVVPGEEQAFWGWDRWSFPIFLLCLKAIGGIYP